MRRALALSCLLMLLAGCDLSMRRQPKYGTETKADLWSDAMAARQPPEGAVAQDQPAPDVAATPPPATPALLKRGQDRYLIYCAPCHGAAGVGDGTVVARGFPRPPDLDAPKLRQADAHHLYDVITAGYGVMYPFADKLDPEDRWAVVAYVRALQSARGTEP